MRYVRWQIEAGITSLVTSAGFMPYEVPFAGKEAYETIVSASKGKLEIIANENIQTKEQVESYSNWEFIKFVQQKLMKY